MGETLVKGNHRAHRSLMRTFTDPAGGAWDVLVGKASWGTLSLLFSRRDAPDTRQLVLAAETMMAAELELEALGEEELRERLRESVPWDGG